MNEHESGEEEEGSGFTIGDIWAIIQMQKWVILGGVVVCFAGAALVSASSTRMYTARATVHLTTEKQLEMNMGDPLAEGTNVWNRPVYLATRIAIMQSSSMKRKVMEEYVELGLKDGITAENTGLLNSVSYIPRKNTELLDVVVTTDDPEMSARLANLVIRVLRDDTLASASAAAIDAKQWLAGQMTDYEARMKSSGTELRAYQREFGMADINEPTTSLSTKMGSLKEAYGSANTERVTYETMLRMHELMLRQADYKGLEKSMESATITQLVATYASALAEQAALAGIYGELHPQRTQMAAQLAFLEKELTTEVKNTIAAERAQLALLRSREADLERAISGGNSELLDVQSFRDEFDKRSLELENLKEGYKAMSKRMEEVELQSRTQLNNVRIIQEASIPKSPSAPNITNNLAAGLVGGLVFGLALAGAREWLDDTISSPLDVATYLRTRLLGIIPRIGPEVKAEKDRSLYTHLEPKSAVAEAIRGIRAVLELADEGAPKRIMVTSAMSGEGKTSTTLRMAIAFANLNRKVLVIDADMRRPRVHKVFGVERVPGLATQLLGESTTAACIRQTEVANLSFMPSGKAFDRPNELLSSPAFTELLAELDQQYDMIFIDTPPSILLSDARLISRHADGVIVVVKERTTSRVVIRDAIRGLQQVDANVLGVVVNNVELSNKRAYAYYGYRYGYGYNYNYRYEEDADDQTESRPA